MASGPTSDVLQQLRGDLLRQDGGGWTDAQLLDCFLSRRDEAAFEALVRRHGPMVLGVCRRMLRNDTDADDAFQAAFLVLVKKADSIRPREMLANWLYGVACHTALKARSVLARQHTREKQVHAMPEPPAIEPDSWNDLRPLLDQELSRLPAHYRAPIVLCDLEGKSHDEAARQLGWPIGTLSGRLSRARKRLAEQLSRRGVALSAAALALALERGAALAAVPAELLASTVKVGGAVTSAAPEAVDLVPSRVADLTEGVLRTMKLARLKFAAALLLVAGLVVAASAAVLLDAPPPKVPPRTWPEIHALPVAEPELTMKGHDTDVWCVAFSPDGKRIASGASDKTVIVWDARTGKEVMALHGHNQTVYGVAFNHDGTRLASGAGAEPGSEPGPGEVKVWDASTGKELLSMKGHTGPVYAVAFSPDGKHVASAGGSHIGELSVWEADTGKLVRQLDGKDTYRCVTYSPDGRWLAAGHMWRAARVWEVATGKEHLTLSGHGDPVFGASFSPDGKRVATAGVDRMLRIWDVETGERLLVVRTGHVGWIHGVEWSRDGNLLVTAGADTTLRGWDPATGKERFLLRAHELNVNGVAFSPDGKCLATASRDKLVKVHRVPSSSPDKPDPKKEEQKDDPKPAERNPRQATTAFVSLALAGKIEEAKALTLPGKFSDKKIGEIKEMGVKSVNLGQAHADDTTALVVSESVTLMDKGKEQKGYLLFTWNKKDGKWLLRDIDFHDADRTMEKQKQFLDRYPNAKPIPEAKPGK